MSEIPYPDVDISMLEYAIWNSPALQHLEWVYIRDKKHKQVAKAQFCEDEYSFYIGDGCVHASEVQWRRIFPESALERAANNYLAVLKAPTSQAERNTMKESANGD